MAHNEFFELNVYKKDPVNKHHWRADVIQPVAETDLSFVTPFGVRIIEDIIRTGPLLSI
jgi:hypothetical protein